MRSVQVKNQSQSESYFPEDEVPSEEPGWEEDFENYDDYNSKEDYSFEGEGNASVQDEEFSEAEFGDPETPAYTAEQERLVHWLEEHNPKILEKSEAVRDRLEEIQGGYLEGSLEDQEKKIRESLTMLDEIETDLLLYNAKENKLEKSGIQEETLFGDQAISKEFEAELEKFQEDLRKALSENSGAQSQEEANEIQKTLDENNGKQLKDRVLDALGHLTKAKKPLYFTAERVWNVDSKRGRYIRKYNGEANQSIAQTLMSDVAAAFESRDWASVKANLGAIGPGNSAHAINLVYAVLSREAPGVLEEMPSEILQLMSDQMRAGSGAGEDPKKTGVFFDTKANYTPKSNKLRPGLGEFGKKAVDSADELSRMAETKKQQEEADAEVKAANEPPPQPFDDGYVDPTEEAGQPDEAEAADEAPSEGESAVDEAVE